MGGGGGGPHTNQETTLKGEGSCVRIPPIRGAAAGGSTSNSPPGEQTVIRLQEATPKPQGGYPKIKPENLKPLNPKPLNP